MLWEAPISDSAVLTPLGMTAAAQGYADDETMLVFDPAAPLRKLVERPYWWPWTPSLDIPAVDTGYQVRVPDAWIVPHPVQGEYPVNVTAALQEDGTVLEFQYTVRETAGEDISIHGGVRDPAGGAAGGRRGSGMTCVGGTLRVGELANAGPIQHALAVTMNMRKWGTQQGGGIVNGYRWPAISADSYYAAANGYGVRGSGGKPGVGMGSLLAIPKSVDLDSLGFETPQGLKIANAYRTYGAYVVDDSDDNDGSWDCHLLCIEDGVKAEFPAVNSAQGAATASAAFRRDMDKIFTRLAVVANNSPDAWGGP